MAAIVEAGVVVLLFEMTELQAAPVFAGAEFDARLAGRVVEDELVVAALPAAAAVELLAFQARQTGAVTVGVGLLASKQGGGVGAGVHGAAAQLVALGIATALPVIDAANDDRAVDVAVLEGDENLLSRPRCQVAAPVAAGDRGHHPQPDAQRLAGRGILGAGRMLAASGGLGAALPRKLDTDAQVAVGMGRLAIADDDGGQCAVDGRPRMDHAAMAVGEQRTPGQAGADGGDLVAIEVDRLIFGFCAFLRVDRRTRSDSGLPEIIAGVVGDGGDQEAALLGRIPVVFRVIGQQEGSPRRGGADAAFAMKLLEARIDRLALVVQHALAVGGALPRILTGVMPGHGGRYGTIVHRAGGTLRAARERPVIPTARLALAGIELTHAVPAVEAVLGEGRAGLGIADAGLGIFDEDAVMVADDQRVATQAVARIGLVLEPAKEPFFGEQAFQEGKIAFAVLHGHAALGVSGGIGQRPAPLGNQLALPFPVVEQFVDDFHDALVLKQVVVLVVPEEGQPGFKGQLVTSKAAVGAKTGDLRDVAVEGTQRGPRGGGLQIEPGRLAKERRQGLLGIARQHRQFNAKTGMLGQRAQGFVDACRFGQQGIRAGRRAQGQEPVALAPAGDQIKDAVHVPTVNE